jgi:hypothetical protein
MFSLQRTNATEHDERASLLLASHASGIASFCELLLGPSKMTLLLGYVVSLVSTFVVAAAFVCAVASVAGTSTHQKHQYASQHKILSKENLGKHHERRMAQREAKDGSVAFTADAAQ